MTPALHVTIPGEPAGAQRPRATRSGVVYMAAKHRNHEAYLVTFLRNALVQQRQGEAFDGAVSVHIDTFHARPKRLQRRKDEGVEAWYLGRPDADNTAKLVLDACTKAGVWRDDTCVAILRVVRRYVSWPPSPGDIPRIGLTVVPA